MPKIVFSFDHEDYLVPETADTAKALADILHRYGIRGAFCTVGERARFLQRLGRPDVIESIARHEVCLHSDRHSWRPTIAERLETAPWDEGVADFLAGEARALSALRETFGARDVRVAVPPGWQDCAPQGFYGYWQLGIEMIAGSFISERPGALVWYCNLLHQRYSFALDQTLRRFPLRGVIDEFEALGDQEYVVCGVHPTILYNSEFVDAHNRDQLERGPHQWKQPPPRPPLNYRQTLEKFEGFVRHVAGSAACETLTYADLLAEHPNPAPRVLTADHLRQLAMVGAGRHRPTGVRLNGHRLSAAEVFGALNWAVAHETTKEVPVRRLFGPRHPPQDATSPVTVDRAQVREAALDIERNLGDFLPSRLPYRYPVSLGGHLRALGEYLHTPRPQLTLQPLPNEPQEAKHPALADLGYAGRWIWPESFTGQRLVELGRLQAWTLKEAV